VVPAASEGHCHTARAGRGGYEGRSIWCLVPALRDGLGLDGWCGDVLGKFYCTCGICVMLWVEGMVWGLYRLRTHVLLTAILLAGFSAW
jgi:hypothetical protein